MLSFDFENENGKNFNSLNDFNIWLPTKCNIPRAERRVNVNESATINGLLINDLKTYKEIVLRQPCEILQDNLINTNMEQLYSWLNGQGGILKLSFYPNRFLNVYYVEPFEITESDKVVNEFLLVFHCSPCKYGDEIIEVINKTAFKNINVVGTEYTPAIVEITPSINLIDLTITGLGDTFTIKNLTAGQKVIIDGEAGTVTQNGVNKFSDFDGWEFPKLSPGANTITFSQSSCDVTIKYKPRWI